MARFLRPSAISAAVLALLWLTTAYRAATQSIVHDEALTWQFYLATPASTIFEYYSANNHFLAVLLMRVVTGIAGYSEFSMRFVSLAAGVLYFYSARRLCLRVFGERWMALLAIALLSLNPLLLDFLVAARGYGPAMALFITGLCLACESLEDRQPHWKRAALAGLCLGGSFAANLIFVLPAVTLTAVFWWVARGRGPWVKFLPLGLAAAGFLLFAFSPVARAQGEDFYTGASTIFSSVDDLARSSLAHNDGLWNLNRENPAQVAWRNALAWVVTPLLLVSGFWLGRRDRSGPALLALLLAVSLGVPAALLLVAHAAGGSPLPQDRTGIYFLGLAGGLLAAVASALVGRKGRLRYAGVALVGVGAAVAAQYAVQLQTRSFLVWRYDADTRDLLELARAKVPSPATAAVSWQFEPAANFYRVTKNWQWLQPVRRDSLDTGGDFYLLLPREGELVRSLHLTVAARGAVSGSYLGFR